MASWDPQTVDPPKGPIPANLYCKACGRPNPCDKCPGIRRTVFGFASAVALACSAGKPTVKGRP